MLRERVKKLEMTVDESLGVIRLIQDAVMVLLKIEQERLMRMEYDLDKNDGDGINT